MSFKYKLHCSLLYALLALAVVCYLPVVIQDAVTYREVIVAQHACCGFVPESRIERPVTYAQVDEWTQPIWKENAVKTERWLTSDGIVNGQTKFWRLLERHPLALVPE